jgi:hypothetical protein
MQETRHSRFAMRSARQSDLAAVAADLRPSDLADLVATSPINPVELLLSAPLRSSAVFAFEFDGKAVAVGGIRDLAGESAAAVWLLGTPGLDRAFRRGALRLCDPWLRVMAGPRSRLCNVIPIANTRTMRWLHQLGFRPVAHFPNYRGLGHHCALMELVLQPQRS